MRASCDLDRFGKDDFLEFRCTYKFIYTLHLKVDYGCDRKVSNR